MGDRRHIHWMLGSIDRRRAELRKELEYLDEEEREVLGLVEEKEGEREGGRDGDKLAAENERLRKGRDTMGNLWAKEKEHREKAEAENERLLTEVRALEMQSAGLRDAVDVLCAENERLKAYKGDGKEQERK